MDVFEPQGALQLYVESLQPSGFGDLAVRFEQLKARLSAEGLFDAARKRPLPDRPAVIAVVTSPTGAVWRDVCNVLARRWPLARVVLVACKVQGEAAPASIVSALRRLERWIGEAEADGRPGDAPAVTILARGGGSLEDLWSFNDERVVRAIVAHPVPVVCGVGHEVDVTLADFAADVRAPTPSAAAELVVPDRADALTSLRARRRRLDDLVRGGLAAAGREVAAERRLLDRLDPAVRLAESRERAGPAPRPRHPRDARPGRRRARRRGARRRPPARPRGDPHREVEGRARRPVAPRWPRSVPRRPSSAATPSSGAGTTTRSSASRTKRRPGPGCAWTSRAATWRRPSTTPRPRVEAPRVSFVPMTTEPAATTAPATLALPDAATLTFDEALAELQRTVAELEAGGQPLERTIALYERGVALHERCSTLLADAELRVQQLVARAGGALAAVDVRPEDAAEE